MTDRSSTVMASDGIPVVGKDAIEILENDHVAVKELFAQLADGGASDNRAATLEQLKALLTVHNATEENLVYPAVRFAAGRPREADTLYHQQDEAEAALWQIDSMMKGTLDDSDLDEKIAVLQKAVLAHVRKEEETEYPHLRESLKSDGLQQLTDAVRQFRSQFIFKAS